MRKENERPHQSFLIRASKYLPYLEGVFLFLVIAGVLLSQVKVMSTEVLSIGLLGLAVVYFLSAYMPVERHDNGNNEKSGFINLLASLIIPKVCWISCAVSAIGINFFINQSFGYKSMIQIGALTIGVASLLTAVVAAMGSRHINGLTAVLYRAVPLFFVDGFILLNASAALGLIH